MVNALIFNYDCQVIDVKRFEAGFIPMDYRVPRRRQHLPVQWSDGTFDPFSARSIVDIDVYKCIGILCEGTALYAPMHSRVKHWRGRTISSKIEMLDAAANKFDIVGARRHAMLNGFMVPGHRWQQLLCHSIPRGTDGDMPEMVEFFYEGVACQ